MCTGVRFNDNKGNFYFGRNLDWTTDYGEKVTLTPRGFCYQSALLGEITPKSGAILGMGIIEAEKPLYFDCVNESGLAVAGLNFPGYAKYESAPVENKINVAAYEFPLWLTLNFHTVAEALDTLKNVAIVDHPINEKYPSSQLHFLLADKTSSVVLEYTERGMEIFENPVDILTNQPNYAWHRENLRNYLDLSPEMPSEIDWQTRKLTPFGTGALLENLPGGYSPTARFVRAAYLNTHYPVKSNETDNLARLFHTLEGVAMIEGAAKMKDGASEITLYTSGYSSALKTYYYKTYSDFSLKSVAFNDQPLDSAALLQPEPKILIKESAS